MFKNIMEIGRGGHNFSRGPNLSTLLVFYRNYVELLPHLDQDLVALTSVKKHYIFTKCTHSFPRLLLTMLRPQVSKKIVFIQNIRITSHYAPSPLMHNIRHDRPFIMDEKLTDIPAEMIKASLMVSVSGERRN